MERREPGSHGGHGGPFLRHTDDPCPPGPDKAVAKAQAHSCGTRGTGHQAALSASVSFNPSSTPWGSDCHPGLTCPVGEELVPGRLQRQSLTRQADPESVLFTTVLPSACCYGGSGTGEPVRSFTLGLGAFYHCPAWPSRVLCSALGAAWAVTPGNEGPGSSALLALGRSQQKTSLTRALCLCQDTWLIWGWGSHWGCLGEAQPRAQGLRDRCNSGTQAVPGRRASDPGRPCPSVSPGRRRLVWVPGLSGPPCLVPTQGCALGKAEKESEGSLDLHPRTPDLLVHIQAHAFHKAPPGFSLSQGRGSRGAKYLPLNRAGH